LHWLRKGRKYVFIKPFRFYWPLEGSKKFKGLVSPESDGGLQSSRFWVLGWSHKVQFWEKDERKSGKSVVIKFKSSSFSARGQQPIKGFFHYLSCKWAIHSRIGTASTISTTLIEFARPIWSTPASWKKKLKRLDSLWSMVVWVVSFQAGGTKLERFLTKNQRTQRKLLYFQNWCSGEAKCKRMPKFDIQSQFSKPKIIWISLNLFFCHWRIPI